MPRVIGIDPGTVSIDLCGLDDGQRLPRPVAADARGARATIRTDRDCSRTPIEPRRLDLIAGPSGYGLPLVRARDLTEHDIRLAQLTAEGETSGGIGGLGSLMRMLARSSLPIVFTPGVVHLASVPAHRKVNRVDMGTADKVCAVALAVHEQAGRLGCSERDVSFILLELGGAFTAAIAVEHGSIVDGVGGTSGPLGLRGAGALDGEVAFLAGSVSKGLLFTGGVAAIAGPPDAPAAAIADPAHAARSARPGGVFGKSLSKPSPLLTVSAPDAREVILSGRVARIAGVR